MSTHAFPRSTSERVPTSSRAAQRPCTLSRCAGTATHTYTICGTRWYRCSTCGVESPEVSTWS